MALAHNEEDEGLEGTVLGGRGAVKAQRSPGPCPVVKRPAEADVGPTGSGLASVGSRFAPVGAEGRQEAVSGAGRLVLF